MPCLRRVSCAEASGGFSRHEPHIVHDSGGDLVTRVFAGTEKTLGSSSSEDTELEEEEAGLAAAAVYKELISDDYPPVWEDDCE